MLIEDAKGDTNKGYLFGLDDVDTLAIGKLDEMIRLIWYEHGPVYDHVRFVLGHAEEREGAISLAIEFPECCAELVGGQGLLTCSYFVNQGLVNQGLVNHGEDVVFAHDKKFRAVKLNLCTRVGGEDHTVALANREGDSRTGVGVERAGSNRLDYAGLGLVFAALWKENPRVGFALRLIAFDEDFIVKGTYGRT